MTWRTRDLLSISRSGSLIRSQGSSAALQTATLDTRLQEADAITKVHVVLLAASNRRGNSSDGFTGFYLKTKARIWPGLCYWCIILLQMVADRLRVQRGASRAEAAQGTPTQNISSPSILVYEDHVNVYEGKRCTSGRGRRTGRWLDPGSARTPALARPHAGTLDARLIIHDLQRPRLDLHVEAHDVKQKESESSFFTTYWSEST